MHPSLLLGMAQSLKDGDTTVEELMKPIRESKEAKHTKAAKSLLELEQKENPEK